MNNVLRIEANAKRYLKISRHVPSPTTPWYEQGIQNSNIKEPDSTSIVQEPKLPHDLIRHQQHEE